MKKAKSDYKTKVASQTKTNSKGFFPVYETKTKEKAGPLKTGNGEPVSFGEGISKVSIS